MKTDMKFITGKIPGLALLALAGLLMVVFAAGCGFETEKANALIDEVNTISQGVQQKFGEVETLLTQATSQLAAGQIEAEKASLTQAVQLIDQITADIRLAKEKTDEAASLNISENYRQYLQAKSRALEASIKYAEATRERTSIFLSDPTLDKPDTLTRMSQAEADMDKYVVEIDQAEADASQIAAENADEIEQ